MPATKSKEPTLNEVLSILPPGKRRGKEIVTVCPLCHEPHLHVKEEGGKVLVKCWTDNGKRCPEGAAWKRIVEMWRSGKPTTAQTLSKKVVKEEAPLGLTLAQYAEMKKLPEPWLQNHFSVSQIKCNGRPAVAIPYFGVIGHELEEVYRKFDEIPPDKPTLGLTGVKIRLSSDSHKTFWLPGTSGEYIPATYSPRGFANLGFICSPDPASKILVICEGESDAQTLWYHGICALGISGVGNWKPEFAQVLPIQEADLIYIIQEPPKKDAKVDAGAEFVGKVAADLVRAGSIPLDKVRVVSLAPAKDPSELYLDNPDGFLAAWSAATAKARQVQKTDLPEPPDTYALTDSGNAERLVKGYGEDFRYIADLEQFYVWNGSFWKPSSDGTALLPYTKQVARKIADPKWAKISESRGKRDAMIGLAKGEPEIWTNRDAFNHRPMLLNVLNGTLDLETQALREFQREDFLSVQAPVLYDPSATCPKFDAFMEFTFAGDKDVIHWVDRALGYTLTGETAEHVFFMCHGYGGNGKTQLFELIKLILGSDLAVPAKFKTFVEPKGYDPPDYELANFVRARLVTASEPSKTRELNEELLKQITGGDTIKARQIYREPFDYKPNFKLWLAMNHEPRIIGTDEGIWRRVRKIPFTQTVPPERRIKDYNKVLFREEGPGILNRLLSGVRDWLAEGLEPIGAIAEATAKYRRSQNAIQRFIDGECVIGPNMHVKCGTLYAAYVAWAKHQGELVMSSYEFSQEMERKYPKRRVHADGEHRFGIGLGATV